MEQDTNAKRVANILLIEMARGASQSLSQFASWLLAGFSAAFTLIILNIESISNFIDLSAFKKAVFIFLLSMILAVLQRWLVSMLDSGFKGGDAGNKIDAAINQANAAVNYEVLLREVENASFYPGKWLVKMQFQKLQKGDLTVAGRQQFKLAQIQGFLMFFQVLFAVWSIFVFVQGIKV